MFIVARREPHPRAALSTAGSPDLSHQSQAPDLTGATEGREKGLLHVKGGPGQEQQGVREWALGSQACPELQESDSPGPEAGSAGRLSQPTVEARCVALGQQLCASVSSSVRRGPRNGTCFQEFCKQSQRTQRDGLAPGQCTLGRGGRHGLVSVPALLAPLLRHLTAICRP